MNLLYLPIALISYFMQAVTTSVDKMIVNKDTNQPVVISFWVALFSVSTIAVLLIGFLPFDFAQQFKLVMPSAQVLLLAVLTGLTSQIGLLFSYRAFVTGEVTKVATTMGAALPILTLIVSFFALGERIGAIQFVGFALLLLGGFQLSRGGLKSKGSKSNAWLPNVLLASLAWAFQGVLAKSAFNQTQFITAYALTGVGAFLYILILWVASSDVRAQFDPAKKKAKASKAAKKQVKWIMLNAALGGLAVAMLYLSIDLGSPSIVSSLRGFQYACIFLIAIILSKKYPKLLAENITKQSIRTKLTGIVLVSIGVIALAANS